MTNDMTNNDSNDLRMPAPGESVRDANDPRLTAYALGELDGDGNTDDLSAVESYLEASPEGRAFVEETRAFAGVLSGELEAEGAPSFGPEQREALTAALDTPPVTRAENGRGRSPGSRGVVLRLWLTSAAAILICMVAWQMATRKSSADDQVRRTPATSFAILDERASGARLAQKDDELDLLARQRLKSLGYLNSGVSRGSSQRVKSGEPARSSLRSDRKQLEELRALGYLGAESAPSSLPAESREQDLRLLNDLVAVAGDDGSGDSSDYYSANGMLQNPLPDVTSFPGPPTSPAGASAPGPGAVTDKESLGEAPSVLVGGQGGGGGSRIDSLEAQRLSKVASEYRRPPGGGGGTFYTKAKGASGVASEEKVFNVPGRTGRPVAVSTPKSEASPNVEFLRALGYIDGAAVDKDDDAFVEVFPSIVRSRRNTRPSSGESYAAIQENAFQPLTQDRYTALSTFGIDVDTASYANVRRYLNRNQAPPANAVRLEEFINAFDYYLPAPDGEHPFSVSVDAAVAPWAPRHRLVRIGLKGVEFDEGERPASNLVFLLDVSGSMKSQDKLPLLIASLKMLVAELDETDRVAIVTYASGSRLVLPSTSGADKATIVAALDGLSAGGSTHASDGIQKAYKVAVENFVEGGVNRVLLATDGDFNVGITQEGQLETFIADKARSGVFLTVLGFGTGNLQDSKAEILADRGNGNYAYIDSFNEAHKVLVRELGGTLVTIAKDVKIQVEFNPGRVAAYRLLGYENRALAAQDFRDDKKDAGEIGAGHTVTALYEIVPVGVASLPGAVELKYQAAPPEPEAVVDSPELLTVNLRYKLPDEDTGREFAVPFVDGEGSFEAASSDFRFAAAVASFGMVLRHSAHRGDVDLATIHAWAAAAKGDDPHGDRAEFLRLVRAAQGLPGY